MKAWIGTIRYYLRQFIELGLLLIGVSVFAEILFGPDVAFFGSQVTKNLVALLVLGIVVSLLGGNVPFVCGLADNIVGLVQSLGDAGIVGLIAAIIILGFYK